MTTVQIDSALLDRLRAQSPGKDDRALIEDLARVQVGFQALRGVQDRAADGDDEVAAEAVRTVRALRRGR